MREGERRDAEGRWSRNEGAEGEDEDKGEGREIYESVISHNSL